MKRAFKNKYLYIFISIALSLLLHISMIALMMKVAIFPNLLKGPKKITRTMKVVHLPPVKKKAIPETTTTSIAPDTPPEIEDQMPSKIPGDSSTSDTNSKYDIPIPDKLSASENSPKLPSIVTVDGNSIAPDRMDFDRNMIPKLPRVAGADYTSIISDGTGVGSTTPIRMRVTLPPSKKLTGSLPVTPETTLLPEEKVIQMDPLIDVSIYKYPLPRGGGFFRIDLSPNKKAAALKTFNKDVILLLDVSGSIGRRRLAEFKQGIENALPTLKPNDRMNIVAFKSKNYPMSEVPLNPTEKNLKLADGFLFKLEYGGTTNIYSALSPYVGMKNRVAERPLIIFLLSDGQVNTGEVVGNRELINAISNQNSGGADIYSYSCGSDRNSFLMDLLSYRNRGESINIPEIRGSSKYLTQFIDAVADVKVADLEYQISSDLADAAFPKRLPNLYKNKTLSIYGRYKKEDEAIGLRITGRDSMGIRREIVIGGSINDAKTSDHRVAQNWAKQYIYHLYSLLSVKYNEKIKNEIHNIASIYRLNLPYLDKHLIPKRKNYIR